MVALPFTAWGQIVSTCDTVDFGRIYESEGEKTIRIFVRNAGSEPTGILKVRPTCGCTAADFQKETFLPGDSAWIDLTYNPYRRPGSFEKGVKVYPENGEMIRIPIKGTVFASETTTEMMFPVNAGLVHLSERKLMPLRPLTIAEKSLYCDVYNTGEEPVYLEITNENPAVDWEIFPNPLPPGEKGIIGFYINPLKVSSPGRYTVPILLYRSLQPGKPDGDESGFEMELLFEVSDSDGEAGYGGF